MTFELHPIGTVRSALRERGEAPRQGNEGAPDAWLEIEPALADCLDQLRAGDEVVLVTWLHLADRTTHKVYPRDDHTKPLHGVFATRSPDRPNPLGLHRVTVRAIEGTRVQVGPLEAIDGTPIVDLKIALSTVDDS